MKLIKNWLLLKMYSLVVPPELVSELYFIRQKTKVSIRKQILQSVESHVKEFKSKELEELRPNAQALQKPQNDYYLFF